MKTSSETELQRSLSDIKSIKIKTIWTHDPDCEREFRSLSKNPGDCFYGEKRSNWKPWQSEVKATCVCNGSEFHGSAYLGGTWERKGENPWESNPSISGYEPQMTVEALEELKHRICDICVIGDIDSAIARIRVQNGADA